MNYTVKFSPKADLDLDEIYVWISAHSKIGATKWLEAFEKRLDFLSSDPYIFPFAPENLYTDFELRHCQFGTKKGSNYRIIYTIDDLNVIILRVRSPRQNLLKSKDFFVED